MSDLLYNEAVELVLKHKRPSARFLKEKLKIGSVRAGKIMDEMESKGIVTELKETGFSGSGGYRDLIQDN